MKIKVEVSEFSGCVIKKFFINGIKADETDFGKIDWTHGEYNTHKIFFSPHILSSEKIIELQNKYYITKEEISEVVDILKDKLSGECSACF